MMTNSLYAMDHPAESAPASQMGMAGEYRLPCPGSRPIVFRGSELAMAMSFTPGIPYWYEINLFRTEGQEFVVAIKLFFQSEDLDDRAKSWMFPTLDEALAHIEAYDAGQDIAVPDIAMDKLVPAELSSLALTMRSEVASIRHHYAGLVGELFMEIEAVERGRA